MTESAQWGQFSEKLCGQNSNFDKTKILEKTQLVTKLNWLQKQIVMMLKCENNQVVTKLQL